MSLLRQKLKTDFLKNIGITDFDLSPIPADASFRTYDRLTAKGKSYILMNSPLEHYNIQPFVDVARLLIKHSMPAPEIYHIDYENGFLVLEDFGNISIKTHLAQNQGQCREIYEQIVNILVEVQKIPAHSLPQHSVDEMLKGIEAFADWYVPFKTGKVMEPRAKDDFLAKWNEVLARLPELRVLGLRDFHVENLMLVNNNAIGLLDFQDATQSHPAYDLVSLLEDARYSVPENIAENMIEHYLVSSPKMNRKEFLQAYAILGIQRNSRILGVFARKAIRDGARQYLDLMPLVLKYIKANEMRYMLKDYL